MELINTNKILNFLTNPSNQITFHSGKQQLISFDLMCSVIFHIFLNKKYAKIFHMDLCAIGKCAINFKVLRDTTF